MSHNKDSTYSLCWVLSSRDLLEKNVIPFVRLYLKNGADPNVKVDCDSRTLLHLAVQNRFLEVVKLLLSYGANVNAQTKSGSTPLYYAAKKCHTGIVRCLLKNNANPNIAGGCNGTPLHVAAARGCWAVIELLLKSGACVDVMRNDGQTPLQEAAWKGHVETVKLLLEFDADINAQTNKYKTTALDYALMFGHLRVVQVLFENGCDVNGSKRFLEALSRCTLKDPTAKVCQSHAIKLKAAELFIEEQTLQQLSPKSELVDLQRRCEEELSRMKSQKVCCHLSLHDILLNWDNPAYLRTEVLIQTLESCDFNIFPIYEGLILNCVRRNKRRNKALISGQKCLHVIFNTASVLNEKKPALLPAELLEQIVLMLGKEDLKSLIRCGEALKQQLIK